MPRTTSPARGAARAWAHSSGFRRVGRRRAYTLAVGELAELLGKVMRGLCLPLLACACALLSLREALATNYAVSSANAKLVCGFSQALKDSAKGLTQAAVSVLERTAEASAEAAILRGRLAAMLRQAAGSGGDVGGAARDTVKEARAQLQAHLAVAEQRIATAGRDAKAAAQKANTYSMQAARLAGHMDGMIAMLATWYGGKSTAANNAMCIAKTPTGSAQVVERHQHGADGHKNTTDQLHSCVPARRHCVRMFPSLPLRPMRPGQRTPICL
ncbi:hypothetical protein ERJ75_001553100 [Trypanosoma vivax]|nr:hypothetical protein ERJ75_001553100 [Trypanosoma vivax]